MVMLFGFSIFSLCFVSFVISPSPCSSLFSHTIYCVLILVFKLFLRKISAPGWEESIIRFIALETDVI